MFDWKSIQDIQIFLIFSVLYQDVILQTKEIEVV